MSRDPTAPNPEFLALQQAVRGRFSLDRELGRGGMGVVFLAHDVALDRLVAIKLLPFELAAVPHLRQRFLQEARMAAGLAHPNIVPIHSVEEADGLVFFVMSFVDGETLGQRVRRGGPLPASEVMRLVQEVAWALGHAHGRGVVHRDVKPDNVMLEHDSGRALVTDFGIAHVASAGDTPGAGSVLGTPQYMSPEQAAGGSVDARSDVYSLGATGFLAAAGRPPFEASTVAGLLAKHAAEPAAPLSALAPRLPQRFAAAIDRCLAKDPADRFASAEELAQEMAAARGALVHVPAPLERFAREAYVVGSEAGGYLTGLAGSLIALEIVKLIEGDWLGIVSALEIVAIVLLTGLSAARVGRLVGMARDLLLQGYDHRALRAALTLEERKAADEEEPARPSHLGTWLTAGLGAGATALGIWGMLGNADLVVTVGTAVTIGAPLITGRRLWERLGGAKLFGKLLHGRLGRGIFRFGGVGLEGRGDALPTVGERTEVALGRVVADLFADLPEEDRRRLGDVPAIVARLEADALSLRERPDDLDAAARLATAVAALETLRLDLMRLRTGAATLDELTVDLEAARKVGEEIGYRLEGEGEVGDVG
jgi:serine/threonine-protein kinase